MNNIKLKIKDNEVGLRRVGENLYEPKSFDLLLKLIKEEGDNVTLERNYGGSFFKINSFPPKSKKVKTRKIKSFCTVATKNIKEEVALMIFSLRKFHKQPIYVCCDKETRLFLKNERLDDKIKFRLINESQLNKINKQFQRNSCVANEVHNAGAILKKMMVMQWALKIHENTMFLDCDIIVLDSLQERFTAPISLSPHYYPQGEASKSFEFGFYNAGYVFCANKGFPKYWEKMYRENSLFFEQECMNNIPDDYIIQTFDQRHNIGFWRGDVDIPTKAKSLHFHITKGVDKNRTDHLKDLNQSYINKGIKYIEDNNYKEVRGYIRKLTEHKKVAFVHFGKAAGVYINMYLKSKVFKNHKLYFSWDPHSNPGHVSGRDWSKKELLNIASRSTERAFLHNHHLGWDSETIRAFKDNGWFLFTFLRRPEELLCSLFNWSKEKNIITCPGGDEPENLEQCFEYALDKDGEYKYLWQLPNYINELDYAKEFTDENFNDFLIENFGIFHESTPRRNVSKNKGFKYYRENGEISQEKEDRLFNSPEYKKFMEYIT